MKQKTFLIICAIVFSLMASYFAIQLQALPELQCDAKFTMECDAQLQLYCLDFGFPVRTNSWCDYGMCWGNFQIYCRDGSGDDVDYVYKGYLKCNSGWDWSCVTVL